MSDEQLAHSSCFLVLIKVPYILDNQQSVTTLIKRCKLIKKIRWTIKRMRKNDGHQKFQEQHIRILLN